MTGLVGREIQADVDQLILRPTAVVAGPVSYQSPSEAVVESGAQVGQLNYTYREDEAPASFHPLKLLRKFAGFVVVGLVALALMPVQRNRFTHQLRTRPWQALGAGFLAMLAVPAAGVLALITGIGAPLGVLISLAFPVAIYLSQVLVSWAVGQLLAERVGVLQNRHWVVIFLLGALITTLLTAIPVFQVAAKAAFLFFGLGGLWFLWATSRETSLE